jgi:hypothetical protein
MKTKPTGLLIVLGILSLVLAAATRSWGKSIEVVSPWVAQAPILDGRTGDWPEQSSTFIKEKDVLVRVCNDSQNVYVMLGFRNPQWAGIIKRSGLTLKLDPQAKNKDAFSVKLIDGPPMEQIRAILGKDSAKTEQMPPDMGERPEMGERQRTRDRQPEKEFICSKKGYLVDKPIPTDGSQGPAAGFGLENGFFAYEFSIPIGESSARFYGLGSKPGQKISIGLIWGEMDKNKMQGGRPSFGDDKDGPPGGGSGFPGGGGGGMPGGGKGGRGGGMGGPPGGGPGGKSGMPEKQEIWLKAQLSLPESALSK